MENQEFPPPKPHLWKPSAIFIDMDTIFGGNSLGFDSPITVTVQVHRETKKTSWFGFTIEVPYSPKAEDDGFGRCHGGKWTALFRFPLLIVQWDS